MTYLEQAALMNDMDFRGRVKVSALKYATSIINEPPNTPAQGARLRWAQQCFVNPQQVATQLQPPVVMDPEVQADGPTISDQALQAAVETVVDKMI